MLSACNIIHHMRIHDDINKAETIHKCSQLR